MVKDGQLADGNFVRAVVAVIDDSAPLHRVTFVVTEVFVGASSRVGDQFVVAVIPSGQSNNLVPAFYPPLVKCEEVLWLLRRVDGQFEPIPNASSLGLDPYPSTGFVGLPASVKSHDKMNARAVSLSKVVREVAEDDSRQRWHRLESLCGSDNIAVAGWAMSVLANVDTVRAKEFLQKAIVSEKLTKSTRTMAQDLVRKLSNDRS